MTGRKRVYAALFGVVAILASGVAEAVPPTPLDKLIGSIANEVLPMAPTGIPLPCVPTNDSLEKSRSDLSGGAGQRVPVTLPGLPPVPSIPPIPGLDGIEIPEIVNPALIDQAKATSPYDRNLIVNGGADVDQGAQNATARVAPWGWSSSGVTAVAYGAYGGFPTSSSPGPAARGLNLFAGGPDSGVSTAAQSLDVTAAQATTDAGQSFYTLGGYLGGYSTDRDNATVSATFLDENARQLGTASIGPLSPRGRVFDSGPYQESATGTYGRSAAGVLPRGTRAVRIQLTLTRVDGAYNDGYADSLSFVVARSCALESGLYGHNLLINGDAESGVARKGSTDVVVPVDGWTTRGNFTSVAYGAPGYYFPGRQSGSTNRSLFAGRDSGEGAASATQTVSLGQGVASGSGTITAFSFSGSFGAMSYYGGGCAYASAIFLSGGAQIGNANIGLPGTCSSKDRGMAPSITGGTLPAGTDSVSVSVHLDNCNEIFCLGGGLADDVVFAIGTFDANYRIHTRYNGAGFTDDRTTTATVGSSTPVTVESATGARPAITVQLAVLSIPVSGSLPVTVASPVKGVTVGADWKVQLQVFRNKSWTPANSPASVNPSLPLSVEIIHGVGSCGDDAHFGYDAQNVPLQRRTAPDQFVATIQIASSGVDNCSGVSDVSSSLDIASTIVPSVPALAITGGIERSTGQVKRARVEFAPAPSAGSPTGTDARLRLVHSLGHEEVSVDSSRNTTLYAQADLLDSACTDDCSGTVVKASIDSVAAGVKTVDVFYDHPDDASRHFKLFQLSRPTVTAEVQKLRSGAIVERTAVRLEQTPQTTDISIPTSKKVVLSTSSPIGTVYYRHAECSSSNPICDPNGPMDQVNETNDFVYGWTEQDAAWDAVRMTQVSSATIDLTDPKISINVVHAGGDVHIVAHRRLLDKDDIDIRGWLRSPPPDIDVTYDSSTQKFTAKSTRTLPTIVLWAHKPRGYFVQRLEQDGTCSDHFQTMYLSFRLPMSAQVQPSSCGGSAQSGGIEVSGLEGSDIVASYDDVTDWTNEVQPSVPTGYTCGSICENIMYVRTDRVYARLFSIRSVNIASTQQCTPLTKDISNPCTLSAHVNISGGGVRQLTLDQLDPKTPNTSETDKRLLVTVDRLDGVNDLVLDAANALSGFPSFNRQTRSLSATYTHSISGVTDSPPRNIHIRSTGGKIEFLDASLSGVTATDPLPPTFTICQRADSGCTDAQGLTSNTQSFSVSSSKRIHLVLDDCESCTAAIEPVENYMDLTLKYFGLAQRDIPSDASNALFLDTDSNVITGRIQAKGYGADGSYAVTDLFFGSPSAGGTWAQNRQIVYDASGLTGIPTILSSTGTMDCPSDSKFTKTKYGVTFNLQFWIHLCTTSR